MIQYLLAVLCSFGLGYHVNKVINQRYGALRLVKNKDKQPKENEQYYIGRAVKDGELVNVSFTSKEIDKGIKRGEKNEEDFREIIWRIKKSFLSLSKKN